jgi:hypothetical protein
VIRKRQLQESIRIFYQIVILYTLIISLTKWTKTIDTTKVRTEGGVAAQFRFLMLILWLNAVADKSIHTDDASDRQTTFNRITAHSSLRHLDIQQWQDTSTSVPRAANCLKQALRTPGDAYTYPPLPYYYYYYYYYYYCCWCCCCCISICCFYNMSPDKSCQFWMINQTKKKISQNISFPKYILIKYM